MQRLYGDSVENYTFYGDFMVKLVWRLSEAFVEKIRQLKFPDKLHINSTIKFPQKVSLSVLPPYNVHNFYISWR